MEYPDYWAEKSADWLASYDANGDGFVTADEWAAVASAELWSGEDAAFDAVATAGEADIATYGARRDAATYPDYWAGRAAGWLADYDTNGDGRVSAAEYEAVASAELWA